jgi:hypothetical protein
MTVLAESVWPPDFLARDKKLGNFSLNAIMLLRLHRLEVRKDQVRF